MISSALLYALSAFAGTGSQEWRGWPREPSPFQGSLVQGLLGLSELQIHDIDFDPGTVDFEDSEDATLPLLGGVAQLPLAGRWLRLGIEAGFTFGWEGDITTLIISNGTTIIAGENDLFLCDLFGGLYADLWLGEQVRLYGGAGPLMQYASVDIEWDDTVNGEDGLTENGFGGGVYARAGLEVRLPTGMMVGLGVRVVEADLDLSGQIDDIDMEELQVFVTATRLP